MARVGPIQQRPLEYEEAVITSLVRVAEADCMVRLVTKGKGRINAYAKNGLKASKSRGAMVQAPARAYVGLYRKPSTAIFRLEQLEIAPHSFSLSLNLRAFAIANYFGELVEILSAEHEVCEEIFQLLDTALKLLSQGKTKTCLLRAFELKLLGLCGYLPDLSVTTDVPHQAPVAFDPISGHLLAHWHAACLPFGEETWLCARSLLLAPLGYELAARQQVWQEMGAFFMSRLRLLRDKPLKSVRFLKEIGA